MQENNFFQKGLLEAYGFEPVVSRNDIMFSYKKGKIRLNHYFTTGTITIQGPGIDERFFNVNTSEELEDILCKIK